jgi:hypothetical protein
MVRPRKNKTAYLTWFYTASQLRIAGGEPDGSNNQDYFD